MSARFWVALHTPGGQLALRMVTVAIFVGGLTAAEVADARIGGGQTFRGGGGGSSRGGGGGGGGGGIPSDLL
ncbi:MAG: hypothetical protein ACI8PZ_007507, partial [Myxococcota bacterium]